MKYFQFTIRDLLLLLGFSAVGLGALKGGGIFSIALLILATASVFVTSIMAFVCTGERRTYSIGFLIPVVLYYWILAANHFGEPSTTLPTTELLIQLRAKFIGAPPTSYRVMGGDLGGFLMLGQLLFALAFGYVGAKVAIFLRRMEVGEAKRETDKQFRKTLDL